MHIVISYPALRNLCFWFFGVFHWKHTCSITFSKVCFPSASGPCPLLQKQHQMRGFLLLFLKLSVSSLPLNRPYTYHPAHTHRNIQHAFFILEYIWGNCVISAYINFYFSFLMIMSFPLYKNHNYDHCFNYYYYFLLFTYSKCYCIYLSALTELCNWTFRIY